MERQPQPPPPIRHDNSCPPFPSLQLEMQLGPCLAGTDPANQRDGKKSNKGEASAQGALHHHPPNHDGSRLRSAACADGLTTWVHADSRYLCRTAQYMRGLTPIGAASVTPAPPRCHLGECRIHREPLSPTYLIRYILLLHPPPHFSSFPPLRTFPSSSLLSSDTTETL